MDPTRQNIKTFGQSDSLVRLVSSLFGGKAKREPTCEVGNSPSLHRCAQSVVGQG